MPNENETDKRRNESRQEELKKKGYINGYQAQDFNKDARRSLKEKLFD